MSAETLSLEAFRLLREYAQRECGLRVGEGKHQVIKSRLAPLLASEGCADFLDLYLKLRADGEGRLRDRVIDAMTGKESSWFRDDTPFRAFRRVLLPEWCARIAAGSRDGIRVWSAGCGGGQEPYSLAICWLEHLREAGGPEPERLEILGTDISPALIAQAREGLYDDLAMGQGLAAELRQRYFQRAGRRWRVAEALRERVRFEEGNLLDAVPARYDAVFCRYTALYYDGIVRRRLLERIGEALEPGGALFLGGSEILGGELPQLMLVDEGGGIHYRRFEPANRSRSADGTPPADAGGSATKDGYS